MTTNYRVAFRVDASEKIGIGHFVRCVTLADDLKRRGCQTAFICRGLPKKLETLLNGRQHSLVRLGQAAAETCMSSGALEHAHFLSTTQFQDARETLEALSSQRWDWIVIDHYALDAKFESMVRESIPCVMVIDDIADRAHDCDILLDQNLYPSSDIRYRGKTPKQCRLLLGPQYALLRRQFNEFRSCIKREKVTVENILVSFGGFDPDNLTQKALVALGGIPESSFKIDVVAEPARIFLSNGQTWSSPHKHRFHGHTSRMAELMANADLGLGAGGSSTWERCCLGLPTLIISFASNQKSIASALHDVGACVFLGDQTDVDVSNIQHAVRELVANPTRLSEISSAAFELVDGLGTDRVARAVAETYAHHRSLH